MSTKNGKEGGVLPKSGIMFSLLLFAGSVKLKKKKKEQTEIKYPKLRV